MNKTIIININGIVFHIEEDAYEILKNYMTDVKRHFAGTADSLEITTDIENRIAEMFNEILANENKQVIVEQDVKSVTDQMGTIADFENAEEEEQQNDARQYGQRGATRRLFRDPDNHLIAGVCQGIANYFDVDSTWIRLAFVLLILAGGSGLMIYIILWIVVPKAQSRADRMAMKGEKQNLQGFIRNFEDEISSTKKHLQGFGHEARPLVYKTRDFIGDLFHHLGTFLRGAAKVFVKLAGIVIILAAFGFCVFIVVTFIAVVAFNSGPTHDFFPFRIISSEHADSIYICAFLAAIIPLISIIMVTLKGIFNVGAIGRTTGTVFLVVWLCALGTLVYYAVKIASNFREEASVTETINLKPAKNNTYYLKLNNIKYFSHDDSVRLDIKDHFKNMTVIDDEYNDYRAEPRNIDIYVEKGDVKYPVLEEKYKAKGYNFQEALFNAGNITYVVGQQDSVLSFDYALRKRPGFPWRDESLELTLKVPANSKVIIDRKLDSYLRSGSVYDCDEINKKDNNQPALFVITDNGLQCRVDTPITPKKDTVANKQKADSTQNQ